MLLLFATLACFGLLAGIFDVYDQWYRSIAIDIVTLAMFVVGVVGMMFTWNRAGSTGRHQKRSFASVRERRHNRQKQR